jgi:hypothetical protein
LIYNGMMAAKIPKHAPWTNRITTKSEGVGALIRNIVARKVIKFVTKIPSLNNDQFTFEKNDGEDMRRKALRKLHQMVLRLGLSTYMMIGSIPILQSHNCGWLLYWNHWQWAILHRQQSIQQRMWLDLHLGRCRAVWEMIYIVWLLVSMISS